ncbi:MAG TPA: sialidase family protein, partial [Spirochaetia bacterium]|nr:sialidase family protein [Spirochaetia bacterium]
MSPRIRALLFACAFVLPVAAARGQEIYWERPQVFDDQGVRFTYSAAGGGRMVVSWEEVVPGPTAGSGTFYLSLGASTNGVTWTWHRRFFGPLQYSGLDPGAEPLLYSMAVQKDGRILVAVTSAEREITILESTDANLSFSAIAHVPSQLSLVAPSLFLTDNGTLLLFATRELTGHTGLSLAWSSSRDGRSWTEFAPFVAPGEPGEGIQLQPDHAVTPGREVIVFQAQRAGEDDYQLFLKESLDGGETWQRAREITGLPEFKESVDGAEYVAHNFTNQRPSIAPVGSGLGLAWERTLVGRATADVYYCELDGSGGVVRPMSRVDSTPGTLFAQIIPFGSRELLLYEQNAAGSFRVILAEKEKAWTSRVVGRGLSGSSEWPHAVAFKGSLYLFWEVKTKDTSRLVALRPKTSVTSPSLVAVGFQPGVPVRSDLATVRWQQPDDSVGIESYDVTVSYGETIVEKKLLVADSPDMTYSRPVTKDGAWRIEVVAQDLARNRSKPVYLDFVRKTTAPHPVTIAPLPTDPSGFLPSNSFTISWGPSADSDVVGYTWEEQRVSATPEEFEASRVSLVAPPDRPLTTGTSVAFDNLENGVHAVTVQAIDRAGNVS